MHCLISKYFRIFQLSFCYLFLVLTPWLSESTFCRISVLLNYGWECGPSQWIFCMSLIRMFILMLLDEVFHKWQHDSANWWCCSVQLNPFWFSACWIWQLLIMGCTHSFNKYFAISSITSFLFFQSHGMRYLNFTLIRNR